MKKTACILSIFLFLCISVFSQDLIVTIDNDSINSKITKIKGGNIYYESVQDNENNSLLMPAANVLDYQFGYYRKNTNTRQAEVVNDDFPHFRIAVNGGYSYMTANIPDNTDKAFVDYYRELKSGYHYGVDLTYYFIKNIGFGGKYYQFRSTHQLPEIYIEENGNRRYGQKSDDLDITFAGPTLSARVFTRDNKDALLVHLSYGYMGYKNNTTHVDSYTITGNTFGTSLDFGYDAGLTKHFAVGVQVSILTGTLTEIVLDDGTTKETIELERRNFESIARIDLSVGLRINL